MTPSITPEHFEQLYAANPDPWNFTSSPYEAEKYAATCAALPRARFRSGVEFGCSFGVLSRRLAARCDRLLALDMVESVLQRARAGAAEHPNITFTRAAIPADWPTGRFDLMVFSEVLYFLDDTDLVQTARLAAQSLEPGGIVVLVNWLGETSSPQTGDEAAEKFIQAMRPDVVPMSQMRADRYRLDILAR
jgi:2-polyprenyl-3-methyl-5-hydroxy-6-metoxy-1,4-benzoquinol methylase